MREQVPDVLVRDCAGRDRRVPHGKRRAQEPARIEVEILLGVVGEDPGLGREERTVGEGGQENVLHRSHEERTGPARTSHGPVSVGAHATARRGPRDAGRTQVPSLGSDVVLVGLTGGIGSGKSTVAAMLVARGAVLIDADQVAREVVEPGREAYAKVVECFGPTVVAPDGSLDRSAIAAIVFDDPASLAELNAIVHPEVRAEIAKRLASLSVSRGVVVLDIPLLVEGDGPDPYGLAGVIVVDAPLDLALERLVEKRRIDRSGAEARIADPASRSGRLARADLVITNTGTLDGLEENVGHAWAWIEALAGDPLAGNGADAG